MCKNVSFMYRLIITHYLPFNFQLSTLHFQLPRQHKLKAYPKVC
jgi:hypothetical protein